MRDLCPTPIWLAIWPVAIICSPIGPAIAGVCLYFHKRKIKAALDQPETVPDGQVVAPAEDNPPAELPVAAGREGIPLGIDNQGNPTGVYLDELQAHALLLGATGSGKTTTLATIIQGATDLAIPVVVIDLKGSPTFRRRIADVAHLAGRGFVHWSLSGDTHWNPLARGDVSELKDKLIGMEAWTEPHYKRAAERYLQTIFTVLEAREIEPSLERIVELMDPAALNAELREVPKDLADRIAGYLAQLADSRDQRSAIAGLGTRLALLTESTAGDRLTNGPDSMSTIDILDSIQLGDVCLFSLDSLRYPELAAQVAGLVIQDLKTVASELLALGDTQALVAIDEFSALDGDQLLGLLARAREAGIGVLLSTQELADLAKVDLTFADQVIANTNVKLIHRQEVPDSAELLAGTIGTYSEWEKTYVETLPLVGLITGNASSTTGSRRLVEKFKLHPNTFKNLRTGQAVLSIKAPDAMAGIINVHPPRINPNELPNAMPVDRQLTPPADPPPPAPQPTIRQLAEHVCDSGIEALTNPSGR